MRGSYYRDEKSNTYTVFDEYLITEEDLPTFEYIRSNLTGTTADIEFVALRYILLYSDMLNARYERLSENEEIQEKIESDINFSEHKRLHVEAVQLNDIVNKLFTTKDWLSAFNAASNLMKNSQKWATDTIQFYTEAGGKGYYIRNNDYSGAVASIRNIRGLIEKLRPLPPVALPAATDMEVDNEAVAPSATEMEGPPAAKRVRRGQGGNRTRRKPRRR